MSMETRSARSTVALVILGVVVGALVTAAVLFAAGYVGAGEVGTIEILPDTTLAGGIEEILQRIGEPRLSLFEEIAALRVELNPQGDFYTFVETFRQETISAVGDAQSSVSTGFNGLLEELASVENSLKADIRIVRLNVDSLSSEFEAFGSLLAETRVEMLSELNNTQQMVDQGFVSLGEQVNLDLLSLEESLGTQLEELGLAISGDLSALQEDLLSEFTSLSDLMTSEFEAVSTMLSTEFADVDSSLILIQSDLDGALVALGDMQSDLSILSGDVAGVQGGVTDVLGGVQSLQDDVNVALTDVQILQSNMTDALARIGEPSSTVFSLLNDILAQLDDHLDELLALGSQIDGLSQDIDALSQTLQNFINSLDLQFDEVLAAIEQQTQNILDQLDADLSALKEQLSTHDLIIRSQLGLLRRTQKEFPASGETHGLSLGESATFFLTTTFAGQAVDVDSPFDTTIVVTVLNGTDGTDVTSPGNITISRLDVGIYRIYVANLSQVACHYGDPIIFVVDWTYTNPSTSHVYYGRDYWVTDSGNFWVSCGEQVG